MLVSPHALKDDVNYMFSAFFWSYGLKDDVYFLCKALVSRHWHVLTIGNIKIFSNKGQQSV